MSALLTLKSAAVATAIITSTTSGVVDAPDNGVSSNSQSSSSYSNDDGPKMSFTDLEDVIRGNNDDSSKTVEAGDGVTAGIDVASHQHVKGDIDWSTVSAINDFTFVKATEGTSYINPKNDSDVSSALNLGMKVGEYHYAKPDSNDAKSEAEFFLDNLSDDTELPPVLDIEESSLEPSALVDWISEWVSTVEDATGKKVMIYTYPAFWRTQAGNTTKFADTNPLWIADYNGKSAPSYPLPGGWSDWAFWQYTGQGTADGITDDVDLNVFNGSIMDGEK